MADKNEEVTLEVVFKELASSLSDAVNPADSDEKENEDSEQENKGSDEKKSDKDEDGKDDSESKDEDKSGDEDKPEFASKADVEAVTAKVANIEQLLTAEDGDFRKSLKEMVSTLQTHGEVLGKALDRIESLESGTAVSKSIEGDDSGDGEGQSDDEKATVGLHKSILHLAKNPGGAPPR